MLRFAPIMAANGKPRQYKQIGAAMVSADVEAIVLRLARQDDRSIAYIIRTLIEDSPKVKAELRKKKRNV